MIGLRLKLQLRKAHTFCCTVSRKLFVTRPIINSERFHQTSFLVYFSQGDSTSAGIVHLEAKASYLPPMAWARPQDGTPHILLTLPERLFGSKTLHNGPQFLPGAEQTNVLWKDRERLCISSLEFAFQHLSKNVAIQNRSATKRSVWHFLICAISSGGIPKSEMVSHCSTLIRSYKACMLIQTSCRNQD